MEIKARLIPYRGGLSVVVIERHHYHPCGAIKCREILMRTDPMSLDDIESVYCSVVEQVIQLKLKERKHEQA